MEHASNVLFSIGPLEVTSTVTTMWAIIAVLTLLSWLATRNLQEVPGPLQNAAEITVSYLRNYYEQNLGKEHGRKYFSVFVIAFFTTHTIGIREKGLKHYLASFTKPLILVVLMLPLNILEQFIRPASLALRLYGNMYGEEMVTETLYDIFPIGVPLIMNVLSLLFCMLQAMVFTMLLSIYVSEAVEEE